ncbi:hypothetical protein CCACVL1_21553 [Corchorus capsularis]|uniref:Uncharacterized protein n=1 Tax=Corchorus capsularis TaxID=210143 RepID=A0A1R3H4M8_COCAP|nr:hypothetical protein CCACVL1_21553 [Corchorus capsularis]
MDKKNTGAHSRWHDGPVEDPIELGKH